MLFKINNIIFKFEIEAPDFELHLFSQFWEFVDFIDFRKITVQEIGVESLEFLDVKFLRQMMVVIGSGNFDSDNIYLVIRLFFCDVRHGFIDLLEDKVDFFHDSVVKGLHKFIDGLVTWVIHFDFFWVSFNLLEDVSADVGIAVFEAVVDHVHEFDVLTDFLELLVEVLLKDWDDVLEVGIEDFLVGGYLDDSLAILCLEHLLVEYQSFEIVVSLKNLLLSLD